MPPKGRRKGDPPTMLRTIEERNAIFLDNQPLITWALGKLPCQVNILGWQTAYDLAELTLLRACGQWDPERGALSTLMFRATMNALDHEVKRVGRVRAPTLVGWNDIIPDVGAGLDPFVELGRADPANLETAEECQKLADMLRRLPWSERDVIRLRFLRQLGLSEIGRRLGICKERVRQIAVRALERLREIAGLTPPGESHRVRLEAAAKKRTAKIRALRRKRKKASA